jgi:hypothetical protein
MVAGIVELRGDEYCSYPLDEEHLPTRTSFRNDERRYARRVLNNISEGH